MTSYIKEYPQFKFPNDVMSINFLKYKREIKSCTCAIVSDFYYRCVKMFHPNIWSDYHKIFQAIFKTLFRKNI